MIYVRLIETKKPIGFYCMDFYGEKPSKELTRQLFWMVDEELNPFDCEFIDIIEDSTWNFSFVFNNIKREQCDEDDPEDTPWWEGDLMCNDSTDYFINDDDLDERDWLRFSSDDLEFYYTFN